MDGKETIVKVEQAQTEKYFHSVRVKEIRETSTVNDENSTHRVHRTKCYQGYHFKNFEKNRQRMEAFKEGNRTAHLLD